MPQLPKFFFHFGSCGRLRHSNEYTKVICPLSLYIVSFWLLWLPNLIGRDEYVTLYVYLYTPTVVPHTILLFLVTMVVAKPNRSG